MFADPLVERYLDVNCSDEEYFELKTWLERKRCPKCLSKEDITLAFVQIVDDEKYLVGEYVKCQCCNPDCFERKFFHRNLD